MQEGSHAETSLRRQVGKTSLGCNQMAEIYDVGWTVRFSGSENVASGLWITRITRPARDDAYIAPQTSRFDA